MLSKKYRLSRKDFVTAKKHGKNFSSPHFSAVIYFPSSLLPLFTSHYSVVTSAKLAKKAVVRNHLRRQFYDLLKTNSPNLKANVIFYPKQSMLNLTREETSLKLNSFLSKINS